MTIPTQKPWNSSQLEHPREPRETAKAGQRRKCHIIDLSKCSRMAGCHVYRLGSSCTNPAGEDFAHLPIDSRPLAPAKPWAWHPAECLRIVDAAQVGQRGKCNRIELSECPGVAKAGQRGKCNRIELSERKIVIRLRPQSSSSNRHPRPWAWTGGNGFSSRRFGSHAQSRWCSWTRPSRATEKSS